MAQNHPTTQQNHYPLNVPGSGGTSHFNVGAIPASNHPVAISQPSGGQIYNPPKHVSYPMLIQQAQNTIPPVSQTLLATTTSSGVTQNSPNTQNLSNSNGNLASIKEPSEEKEKNQQFQTNGTTESETEKSDVQGNHVNTQTPASVPHAQETKPDHQTSRLLPQTPEKPKSSSTSPEKKPESKPVDEPTPEADQKAETVPGPSKTIAESANSTVQTPSIPVIETVSSESVQKSTLDLPSDDTEPESNQNEPESVKETAPDTDPLAIDSSAAELEEKPSQTQEKAFPVIDAVSKDVSDDGDKSSEEQSSEETSEDQKDDDFTEENVKTPARKTKATKPEPKSSSVQKSPSSGKTKRQRIRTQHYQSPLPEIEIVTKLTSTPRRSKGNDEKLIYFYKNEFLALRNAEGGFFLCQAAQNIYKSSSKIKIRWLSQDKADKSGEIYTPDFYDFTDFDCILTSLDLTRVGKGRYKLKPDEKSRTINILKRCLAVEKGEIVQSVSEEHPDGLDLSLYKDEEQLMKKKQVSKRKSSRSVSPKKTTPTVKTPQTPKVRKVEQVEEKPVKVSSPVKKTPVGKKAIPEPKKATPTSIKATRGKTKKEVKKNSPVVDQKKAKVLAKIGRKVNATVPDSSNKSPPSKSAKVTKPVPSTSKASKTPTPSKPPPRKSKRAGKK